jgi:hypothetical protein
MNTYEIIHCWDDKEVLRETVEADSFALREDWSIVIFYRGEVPDAERVGIFSMTSGDVVRLVEPCTCAKSDGGSE